MGTFKPGSFPGDLWLPFQERMPEAKGMRSKRMILHLASLSFFLAAGHSLGQGAEPVNPAPAGVTIEPVVKGQVAETKFTNGTDRELAIVYGIERFRLPPGKSKSVPNPQQAMVDLRIADLPGKGMEWRQRFEGKEAPKAPKRLIPFPWAKPNKP
jgi:hypothetical protein